MSAVLEELLLRPELLTGNLAKLRVVVELAERLRASERPLAVVDVGCAGPTPFNLWDPLLTAWPDRLRLTGVDVRGVERTRAVAESRGYRVELLQVDGYAFAAALGRTFDAVVSTQVLEHVRRPLPFLREVRKLLLPGGTAWLTFDSGHFRREALVERVRHLLGPVLPERFHDRGVTAERLRELADGSGFEVEELRYANLHPLKQVDNHEVSPPHRAAYLRAWMALEDALAADEAFLAAHRDRFAGIGARLRAV